MDNKVNALVLDQTDHVGVALEDLKIGHEVLFQLEGQNYTLRIVENIPIYHKFALIDIREGDLIRKYGQVIGRATHPIKVGEHVHEHNLVSTVEVKEGDK